MSEYRKINNLYLSLKKMGLEKEAFEILKIANWLNFLSNETFTGKVINLDSESRLRIRQGPGLNHEIIGHLSSGDTFDFLGDEENKFLKIKTDKKEGWIHSNYAEYSDSSGAVKFRGIKDKVEEEETSEKKSQSQTSSESTSVEVNLSGGISSPVGNSIIITSPYDWRTHPTLRKRRFHHGLDIRAKTGTEVKSIEDGVVSHVGDTGAGGNTVVVKSYSSAREWSYMHLSQYKVKKGDSVRAGQVIALSGNSGRSSAPHLHLKLTVGGPAIDPLPVIKEFGIPRSFKHKKHEAKHG